jgi:RNA polymerase sigma factor (TIGR02999 family)
MSEVSRILDALADGDPHAAGELLPLVYDELRRLAAQKLAGEAPGPTLQPTALVHEAYLRLVGTADERRWESRGHFFAAAAEAMRRILVENARRRKRHRHGGGRHRVGLAGHEPVVLGPPDELLALDEALSRLAQEDPLAAQVVKLRYFTGLSVEQAAEALGISRANGYRQWAYAKAWLRCALDGGQEASPG